MDEALELNEFLPLSFKNESEQAYIAFLWDAFGVNYSNGKYQFAFLAYHMLTMSVVYFNIWQIRQTRPNDFGHGLIGFSKDVERNLIEASSPFVFSTVNERSILRFLKLLQCDNDKIGKYAKLVDDRNYAAHPNGNIFCSTQKALDLKIADILRAVEEIQAHSKAIVQECYRTFLIDSEDADEREHASERDQVQEALIHANYLSLRDAKYCAEFDISPLQERAKFESIKLLHSAMIEITQGVGDS